MSSGLNVLSDKRSLLGTELVCYCFTSVVLEHNYWVWLQLRYLDPSCLLVWLQLWYLDPSCLLVWLQVWYLDPSCLLVWLQHWYLDPSCLLVWPQHWYLDPSCLLVWLQLWYLDPSCLLVWLQHWYLDPSCLLVWLQHWYLDPSCLLVWLQLWYFDPSCLLVWFRHGIFPPIGGFPPIERSHGSFLRSVQIRWENYRVYLTCERFSESNFANLPHASISFLHGTFSNGVNLFCFGHHHSVHGLAKPTAKGSNPIVTCKSAVYGL